MIMVKCKYEGTGIWNGRCVGTKEVDPCPGYDKCKEYKPDYMTNADRIRAMTGEELATMLKDYKDCSKNCIISNGKHCYQICEEESVLLKWLQQPAE